MKPSGIPWLGDVPAEWEIVKTKRIFRSKKRVVGNDAENFERLALTMNGVIKRNKDDSEGLQPQEFSGYQILEKNELVFKLIDLQNVRTSRVGLSPFRGIVSPAYITLQNNQEDNRFFYYYFMTMYYQQIFNHMGDDGVRSSIGADDLLNIQIPFPPVAEQKVIADYLDGFCGNVDELIALKKTEIEKLKQYKQSLISETVTQGLNKTVPVKPTNIPWIKSVPAHWEMQKLGQIMNVAGGLWIGKKEPFIRVGVIRNANFTKNLKLRTDNIEYLEVEESQFATRKLEFGDIIVEKSGGGDNAPVGRPVFFDLEGEFSFSNFTARLRVRNNGVSFPKYFYYVLSSFYYVDGTKNVQTNTTNLRNLMMNEFLLTVLPFPPLEEQEAIAEFLDERCSAIDELIRNEELLIENLVDYKKSVIFEIVTGKRPCGNA